MAAFKLGIKAALFHHYMVSVRHLSSPPWLHCSQYLFTSIQCSSLIEIIPCHLCNYVQVRYMFQFWNQYFGWEEDTMFTTEGIRESRYLRADQ